VNALVTGGAGFIGSHLVDTLIAQGAHVRCLDDGSAGDWHHLDHHPSSVLERLHMRVDGLAAPSRVNGLRLDTGTLPRPDVIFHLAGHLGVEAILDDPLSMLREHPADTDQLCAIAHALDATLVVTSTSEVYAMNQYLCSSTPGVVAETEPLVVGPSHVTRSGYAVSKLLAEHIALAWAQKGVRVVIARIFNAVGPRQRAERGCVLPKFCRAAVRGEPLLVHDDGSQRRCFTHVEDVVRALIGLAQEPRAWGQVVNVGCSASRTIQSVADDVMNATQRLYGHRTQITHVPFAELPPQAGWELVAGGRVPCNQRIHGLLGWEPPDRWSRIVDDTLSYWAERETEPVCT